MEDYNEEPAELQFNEMLETLSMEPAMPETRGVEKYKKLIMPWIGSNLIRSHSRDERKVNFTPMQEAFFRFTVPFDEFSGSKEEPIVGDL